MRWCILMSVDGSKRESDARGHCYYLLKYEGLERHFGQLKWLSSICAQRPIWIISHFITCCQSQSAFLWAREHRWGKATKRGRCTGWFGRAAAPLARCYLTETDTKSLWGSFRMWTVLCSVADARAAGVLLCVTPGGLYISWQLNYD